MKGQKLDLRRRRQQIATLDVTWTDEGQTYRARIELAPVRRGGYLIVSDVGGDARRPYALAVYPLREEEQR